MDDSKVIFMRCGGDFVPDPNGTGEFFADLPFQSLRG
jgi:hypothetical protein